MKKKFFDFGLFREAFRELKAFGLLFLVINALMPVLMYLSSASWGYVGDPMPVSLFDMAPLLFTAFIPAASILSLKAFGFTASRKASDFFHAVPQTRLCVFFSFFGAVIAWLTVIILVTALLGGLGATLLPLRYEVLWERILTAALAIWIASFLTAAVTACAAFLTGTVLAAVIMTAVLLIGPRLVLYFLTNEVYASSGVALWSFVPFPISYRTNIVSNILLGVIDLGEFTIDTVDLYNGWILLYSFCVGLAATAFAAFLAHRRASENAEDAIPNRYVRAVVRLSLAFMVLLPVMIDLFRALAGGYPWTVGIEHLVYILTALLLYFGFEMLMKRSVRAVRGALPALPLLPVICAVGIGIMLFAVGQIRSFKPAPDEILWVRNVEGDSWSVYGNGAAHRDYFDVQKEQVRQEEAELKEIVSRALAETLEGRRSGYQGGLFMDFAIADKSGEHLRGLALTREESDAVLRIQSESPGMQEIYSGLPDPSGNRMTLWISSYDAFSSLQADSASSREAKLRIYEAIRREAAAVPASEWAAILNGTKQIFAFDSIVATLEKGGSQQTLSLPISPDLPESFAVFREELEKASAITRGKMLSEMDRILSGMNEQGAPYTGAEINVTAYSLRDGISSVNPFYYSASEQDTMHEPSRRALENLREGLRGAADDPVTEHPILIRVDLLSLASSSPVKSCCSFFAFDEMPDFMGVPSVPD